MMKIKLVWWGWPWRFRIVKYMPTFKIFRSIDIGPFEIRIIERMKFKYQTIGPLIAKGKRMIDRGKIKLKKGMNDDQKKPGGSESDR